MHPGDFPVYEYGLRDRLTKADEYGWWDPVNTLKATVYLNHGRWVAACPRCDNAEHWNGDRPMWEITTLGDRFLYHGGLSGTQFLCSTCYIECQVEWPENRFEIWEITKQRPAPTNRNWLPGESLDDLRRENAEHGVSI